MRVVKAVFLAVGSTVVLGGCAIVGSPLPGLLYTDVKYPSYYDGAAEKGPGTKAGQAQAMSILGLIATGDASIDAACRNGGIGNIQTVDTHAMSVLGLFATYTTKVTGE